MKKMFFIFNPLSGKAHIKNKIGTIIDIFTAKGYIVTAYPTQYKMDAFEKVKIACEQNYEVIVCSGGDGTLNEVIQGMMSFEGHRPPLGYIPTGTTNDFARSIGIPRQVVKAAEMLTEGVSFACDVGSFNNRYFTYIAAFGAFTDVSYETTQQAKNVMGHAAYVFEGFKRVGNIKSYKMKIEYDGKIIEDEFAYGMVTNSSSVAGLLSQDDVLFDDGLYEVTLIKKPSSVVELNEIAASLLNITPIKANKSVIWFRTSELTIEVETDISWTLDGEFGGNEKRVCIKNCKQAIEFIVDEETRNKKSNALTQTDFIMETEA